MKKLPVGILLAAGQSRRFDSNKLLYPVLENQPLLMVTARKLAAVLPESVVVISSHLLPFTDQLMQIGMHVVINEEAERGMGSSISCGVRASEHAKGWLIALADMPYIKTETIMQLANRLKDGAGIIAPKYDQQRGHPVGFNQQYKDELIALSEEIGARRIIERHKNKIELLETDDAGVITDIDQVSDIIE